MVSSLPHMMLRLATHSLATHSLATHGLVAAWFFFGSIAPPAVRADVVVLANRTREDVPIQIAVHAGTPEVNVPKESVPGNSLTKKRPRSMTLRAGQQIVLPVEGPCQLLYDVSGELVRYQLDANSVYFFSLDEKGWLDLSRVDLGSDSNAAISPSGNSAEAAHEFAVLPIKILVDNHDPTPREVWERRLRKRIDRVSQILQEHCRLQLKIVAVETWNSGDQPLPFHRVLTDFRERVDRAPGCLAIGFTGRYQKETGRVDLGVTQGMLQSHILIREWAATMSEPERTEVLLHEIGHYLGAVHSPDSGSVMRPVLADDKAIREAFRIGFDPANTLIINLISDEIRSHRANSVATLSPPARQRLAQVYGALLKATPRDKSIQQFLSQVKMAGGAPLTNATRLVVRAVRSSAPSRQATPAAEELSADQLTEQYIRRAATVAQTLPDDLAPSAFLLGLGIAMDHSDTLLHNPFTAEFCQKVETEAERSARHRALGRPTLRGRRDLAQHFFLSAYLTAVVGAPAAEKAGLVKELADSHSQSGFSYRDLAADVAGIHFAQRLLNRTLSLSDVARGCSTDDLMPEVADLPEGVPWSQLGPQLKSQDAQSVTHYRNLIRDRVHQLSNPAKSPPALAE